MKHRMPTPRKGAWFVVVRNSYLPCSWQGWASYIPFVGLLLYEVHYTYHWLQGLYGSKNDTGIGLWGGFAIAALALAVNVVITGMLMTWFARRKS